MYVFIVLIFTADVRLWFEPFKNKLLHITDQTVLRIIHESVKTETTKRNSGFPHISS